MRINSEKNITDLGESIIKYADFGQKYPKDTHFSIARKLFSEYTQLRMGFYEASE